jgi:small-conductance mechanosensitive channel
MDFLITSYLGNSLQDWLVAVCIFVLSLVVLKIVLGLLISRLGRLADATAHEYDDLLVAILKNTKLLSLIACSAYFASTVIVLKPGLANMAGKAVMLVLILQSGFWAGSGISFWLQRNMQRQLEQDRSSATTIAFLGFLARVCLWVIVLLLILDNLGVNITGLVAGLGIGGIAVALAVQNILGDLLASLSIVLDKPFVIGDFIVVDNLSGTIEHIGLKTTRIRSLSGEQLIFSNNDLLKSRVHNYKRMSERRIVFGFGVVYQTSLEQLQRIKTLVGDIIRAEEQARLDRVHFKNYGDSALNFEVVYFVKDSDYTVYMDLQERINLGLFKAFGREGIEFAYPTQTIFVQQSG